MSNISWMENEAYKHADEMEEMLNKAYKQGIDDAWNNVKDLWNNGVCSFEWSADEMMRYAENDEKNRKNVEKLAEEIGIHKLYAIVCDMRGESNEIN